MRLSEWRGLSPHKDALGPKVVAVIEPILTALGAEPDPECWISWGDDPAIRYLVFAPSPMGLVQVHVRVNVPQEGPRASGKLIRWNRVQVGELAIEMASGHRLLSFQVEGQVLRGSDRDADAIAAFALVLFAAIDGRTWVPPVERVTGRRSATARDKGPGGAKTAVKAVKAVRAGKAAAPAASGASGASGATTPTASMTTAPARRARAIPRLPAPKDA